MPRLTRCGFDEVEESLSEPHGGELIAHHKEGSMYIIRWKSVSIDDSAGGEQVRLITMSKIPVDQINRVAELPWQELTVLLDSIHDGIWVIDSDGITLRVNKAMERIAGLRAEEVIGKHVTEPMHKGRFETCVTLRALIEKRSVTMFDDYSNGKRCLNTSTPIFDEKGNVWRVIASIRDMTELETLQRKLTDLEMETLAYKARLENLETEMDAGFVGHSAPMRRLRKEASKAARTEAITLILGETGTGKTLTAKAIHDMGQRSAEPFIAVNCGAIPMSLMESELFGYEKGAFTGAAKSGKPGMFELAHKGTLLLDEIGELPLPMQAKLLQVLDGHPFHRVGGTKPITVDVRVIAATN
ncbi:sigma 54-interacting transcriptional regulator, partial [Bilophila wadsworthia]